VHATCGCEKCSFTVGIETYIFDRTPAASDTLCVDFEASLTERMHRHELPSIGRIKESLLTVAESVRRNDSRLRNPRERGFFRGSVFKENSLTRIAAESAADARHRAA